MKAKKRVAKKKVVAPEPKKPFRFTDEHASAFAAPRPVQSTPKTVANFAEWTKPAMPPPGVGPGGDPKLAMDGLADCGPGFATASAWAGSLVGSAWTQGLVFPGYPYLSELALRAEYRRLASILPMHATRSWIKLKSASDEDKTAKIMALTTALERFNVKEHFQKVGAYDNLFGRGHLYVDLGDQSEAELKTPIGDGTTGLTLAKVKKGSLKGFRPIEPIWCYPTNYDSINPLSSNWYDPERWFVMAQQIHRTRLLKFVSREVPDILKPAYSFGGLALSQIAEQAVNNWLRTRQSVSDLIHSFSVSGIKTDLSALLGADGNQLAQRANLFNVTRDNKGLMILQSGPDGSAEEFFNVSTPLSTLDELQAQAQEHMCAIDGYPVLILLGLTPHGLNPSSEGEIKSFNSRVRAYQEGFMSPHLKTVIDIVQINEFGELDPDITFEWNSLEDMTDLEKANIEKIKADTGAVLIGDGTLDPSEERQRIAADPDSDYANIEVDDMPLDPLGLEDEEELGLEQQLPRAGREGERPPREGSAPRPTGREDRSGGRADETRNREAA